MRAIMIFLFLSTLTFCFARSGGAEQIAFGGVGIDGAPVAEGILVRQMVTGGPAQAGGIRTGDIITHVDGTPIKGSNFKQTVTTRLRGKAGSKVRLTVTRKGEKKPLQFNLVRRTLVARSADAPANPSKSPSPATKPR